MILKIIDAALKHLSAVTFSSLVKLTLMLSTVHRGDNIKWYGVRIETAQSDKLDYVDLILP